MTTILFRTLIVYISLIVTMRLMGKRQIGELEVTDLVTTLLLSEIASLPVTNQEIPVLYAIIPMVLLLVLEVLSSWVLIRFPHLRVLVSASPSIIIHHGVLDQRALRELRISLEELMSEIRQQGLCSLDQVECAIVEKNGKLTIVPKPGFAPVTAEQMKLTAKPDLLSHIVYYNGSYSAKGLSLIGKDRAWLDRQLKKRRLSARELFCVTANEDGELFYLIKEEKQK